MGGFFKAIAYAAVGLLVVIPVGLFVLTLGVPLLAVGGVIAGVVATIAFVVALPILIIGGIGFAILGAILGIGIAVLKLLLFVAAAAVILHLIGRAVVGGKKGPPMLTQSAQSAPTPVRDAYEIAAERELDEELGMR